MQKKSEFDKVKFNSRPGSGGPLFFMIGPKVYLATLKIKLIKRRNNYLVGELVFLNIFP